MFNRTHSFTRAVITGGLLSVAVAAADTQAAQQAAQQPPRPAAAAPAEQAPASPDADLVARIRKSIADDKALANYAQTLKIIASDGLVSLKGPVRSEADKKALGEKADQIAGAKNVMNNLIVTADAGQPNPETR
jgi:osmotically-inducible protein OsmY